MHRKAMIMHYISFIDTYDLLKYFLISAINSMSFCRSLPTNLSSKLYSPAKQIKYF